MHLSKTLYIFINKKVPQPTKKTDYGILLSALRVFHSAFGKITQKHFLLGTLCHEIFSYTRQSQDNEENKNI